MVEIPLSTDEFGLEGDKCYSALYFGAEVVVNVILVDQTMVTSGTMLYTQNGSELRIEMQEVYTNENSYISGTVDGSNLNLYDGEESVTMSLVTTPHNTDLGLNGTKWLMQIDGAEGTFVFERNIVCISEEGYIEGTIYNYDNLCGYFSGNPTGMSFEVVGDNIIMHSEDYNSGLCFLMHLSGGVSPSNEKIRESLVGTRWESDDFSGMYGQRVFSGVGSKADVQPAVSISDILSHITQVDRSVVQSTNIGGNAKIVLEFAETMVSITFPGEEPVEIYYTYSEDGGVSVSDGSGMYAEALVVGQQRLLLDLDSGVYLPLSLVVQ